MTNATNNAEPFARAKQRLAELLADQQVGVLASTGPENPCCNLIAFVATDDFRRVAFVTPRATRKFANLQADPGASILIDDREKLAGGFHAVAAATAIGQVDEPTGPEHDTLLKIYLAKHPALESFARSDLSALLVLRVSRWVVVDEFQNVIELQP
jgi:hypothetical protein